MFNKPVQLSNKEILRADRSNPKYPFTIISRKDYEKGGFVVAAIDLNTGLPLFDCAIERAETREGIGGACKALCRWIDKETGLSTKMTKASRHGHK